MTATTVALYTLLHSTYQSIMHRVLYLLHEKDPDILFIILDENGTHVLSTPLHFNSIKHSLFFQYFQL